jgi:hypothetical protein
LPSNTWGYHQDSNAVSPNVFGIQKEGTQKSSGNANEAVKEEKNVKQNPCTERDLTAFIFQVVTTYHMGRRMLISEFTSNCLLGNVAYV